MTGARLHTYAFFPFEFSGTFSLPFPCTNSTAAAVFNELNELGPRRNPKKEEKEGRESQAKPGRVNRERRQGCQAGNPSAVLILTNCAISF